MRKECLAVSLAILLSQSVSAAASPSLMTPSGPWNVDFGDRMCVLDRPYGVDGATSLILKPAMLGNGMEIAIARKTTAIGDLKNGKAVISIAGSPVSGEAFFTAYSTAKVRLLRTGIDNDKVPLAAIAGTLWVDAPGEGSFAFAIPGIAQALPVLGKCLEELRANYKVGDADVGTIVTKPKGNAAALFSTNDYPREAMALHQSGTVGVLVWIETDGRVSSCQIIESNASSSLEQTTCSIIQRRGRFIPAIDAANKAVRAPSFYRIRWMLAR